MDVVLKVVALTVFLFLAQEVLRRAGKWVVWSLFVLVPLALTQYWVQTNDFGPFIWIKIYSVCFCVFWGAGLRFTSFGDRPWARLGIPLLLAGNIIEATILDVIGHGLAHSLNAVAGIGLIAMLTYNANATRIDAASRSRDLYYGTTPSWIIAYTVWNWAFVLLNYPSLAGQHTAVLACGLIVGLSDPRRWVQTRACSLGLMLLGMATFNTELLSWMDTSNWSGTGLEIVAAFAALALTIKCSVEAYPAIAVATTRGSRSSIPCVVS